MRGTHSIEVLGGEVCCDEATTWTFSINGGKTKPFTKPNIEGKWPKPKVDPDPEKPEAGSL